MVPSTVNGASSMISFSPVRGPQESTVIVALPYMCTRSRNDCALRGVIVHQPSVVAIMKPRELERIRYGRASESQPSTAEFVIQNGRLATLRAGVARIMSASLRGEARQIKRLR